MNIIEIAYHRNGISGAGFHAVTFEDDGRTFVSTVFEAEGHIAVLEIAQLPVVTFGENSWRGDRYADYLRKAICAYETELIGGRA